VLKTLRNLSINYSQLLRASYFILTVVVIVLFMPREGKFKFEFQRGTPWMHEDLNAPFDFPIYKTDSELLAERHAILRGLKPFFSLDSTAEPLVKRQLQADADLSARPPAFRVAGKYIPLNAEVLTTANNLLSYIYSKGVIDPNELNALGVMPDAGITILINNIAYDTPISAILTVEEALDYLSERIALLGTTQGVEQSLSYAELPLRKYINPNLVYEEQTTAKVRTELLRNLSLTRGMIQAGERIVVKGDVITQDIFVVLESLRREHESRIGFTGDVRLLIFGQTLLVGIIFLVLFLFLQSFRHELLRDHIKTLFILMLVSVMVVISAITVKMNVLSIYIIPFAVVPIFIRAFYDSRLALFVHLITIFMVGFFAPNSFEFVFYHFIAGIVAIVSLTNFYQRRKLFLTIFMVLTTYWLLYIGMVTIQEGTPMALNPIRLLWYAGNAMLILAAYQLIYIFEKVFGFLSDTSLMELSDSNHELLRQLAEVAPGTFQHCLQVANLAEAAIFQIGGNPLLIRAGALYHDIGKMGKPYYFVENQSPEYNPHQNLDFEESAEIIIAHVTDGVQMAKRHRLPQQIIDFIRTHHGTTKVQYFFRLFKEKFPNAKADFPKFRYPGPVPFSREMAVLMMADSVEAASRALKSITPKTINDLVDSIINYQQDEEQFSESDITFKDISVVKQVFKKKLMNIYHARIEYPKDNNA
jgi:cyclic-di-AMP phosphodiesterase PgpH